MTSTLLGILALAATPALADTDAAPTGHRAATILEKADPVPTSLDLSTAREIVCVAHVDVNAMGTPVDARVAECDVMARGQVARALLRWRWTPELRHDEPVASTHTFEVTMQVYPAVDDHEAFITTNWERRVGEVGEST